MKDLKRIIDLIKSGKKPSRPERKIWLSTISIAIVSNPDEFKNFILNNLHDMYRLFKLIHPKDYKSKNPSGYRAYILFKKLYKTQKNLQKNMTEDKLSRRFLSIVRNNNSELMDKFIDTEFKLRSLLKLSTVIYLLHKNLVSDDKILDLDFIKKIVQFKLNKKLQSIKQKSIAGKLTLSPRLKDIFPLSIEGGGDLNAIHFFDLMPRAEYIDKKTCPLRLTFLGIWDNDTTSLKCTKAVKIKTDKEDVFITDVYLKRESNRRSRLDIDHSIRLANKTYKDIEIYYLCIPQGEFFRSSTIYVDFTPEGYEYSNNHDLEINLVELELSKHSTEQIYLFLNLDTKTLALTTDNCFDNLFNDFSALTEIFKLRERKELSAFELLKSSIDFKEFLEEESKVHLDLPIIKSLLLE